MAEEVDFPLQDIENLPLLPSQSSPIPQGQYVVKSTREVKYESPDSQFNSQIWYSSPPLDQSTIQRINKLQLFAESHDQGHTSQPLAGNWTWFELAILEDGSATSPRVKDGVNLVWRSHRNRFQTTEYGWKEGTEFDEEHDLFRLLEPGNAIAVRICARFEGSVIAARTGLLVFDIGSKMVSREPVEFGGIVTRVETLHNTFTQVNLQTGAAFVPSLPEALFRADLFRIGDEGPLRVLALDGGGVRGMSSLKLLQKVMEEGAPGKKPCEVFDMIGGTSTGGLIAIMLGRLRMTISETIAKYELFMTTIFGKGDLISDFEKNARFATTGDFYDATILEKVTKDIIREKLGKDDATLLEEQLPNGPKPCRVFCMAVRRDAANNRGPVFLRSYIYNNGKDKSLLPNIKIWEAARATSAAPAYFAPMKVGGYELLDGGLEANNPLGWLWTEVLGVYGAARPTNCFLSIGTGIPPNQTLEKPSMLDPMQKSMKGFASIATNTEIVNILFRTLIDAFAPKPLAPKYFRLNIGEKTGDLGQDLRDLHSFKEVGGMDNTKALAELLKTTDRYITAQAAIIADCAKALKA